MKIKSILWVATTTTAVCLALPGVIRADDQEHTTGSGSSEMHHRHHMMGSDQTTGTETHGAPSNLNKASHIIGMTVENQNHERLGKVKDIVFNWQSGQASYVVLDKANPAKGTSKYVAVPVTAFKPSDDKKNLVLNVDKNRVENAKGFAENNWPAMGATAFGAQPAGEEEIIILQESPAGMQQHQNPSQNSKEHPGMTAPDQKSDAGSPNTSSDTDNDNDSDTDSGSSGE